MKHVLKAIAAIAAMSSFCASAAAQILTVDMFTTPSQPVSPTAQPPASDPISPPKPVGPPHVCGLSYYPMEALAKRIDGVAEVDFRVSIQGKVTQAQVVQSSGSRLLDYAAILCTSWWRYEPAVQNGHAIEIPLKVLIIWSSVVPTQTGPQHVCPASVLPADNSISVNGQPTSLYYHITVDGAVRDVVVSGSSGNAALDQLAVNCVSQWRYLPSKRDGEPFERLWGGRIKIPLDMEEDGRAVQILAIPREFGSRDACRRPSTMGKAAADSVLTLEVRKNGSPGNARLLQSSGNKALDDVAVACAATLRFIPAFEDGQSVDVTIPVRIAW